MCTKRLERLLLLHVDSPPVTWQCQRNIYIYIYVYRIALTSHTNAVYMHLDDAPLIKWWFSSLLWGQNINTPQQHYDDVIMTMLASQITSLAVVYSIVYSGVNQRKHQSSASLAFVREIHRGPVNFPHKWPVTRKMFPFDDVIMSTRVKCGKLKRWMH